MVGDWDWDLRIESKLRPRPMVRTRSKLFLTMREGERGVEDDEVRGIALG